VVRRVFIAPVPYCFGGVEGLESLFLLITLMRDKYLLYNIKLMTNIFYTILIWDKYLLHNINSDDNMVGSYKNFIHRGV